jgi:hypothetical protein
MGAAPCENLIMIDEYLDSLDLLFGLLAILR